MSMTIKEALQRASFQLRAVGLEQPRREAEALLSACSGLTLAYIYAHGENHLTSLDEERYLEWVLRRSQAEPYAYIVGEREFLGLPFFVTPDVLIPRPETELLVETVAAALRDIKVPSVLEIGTGSGAVAVMLALLLPEAGVVSVDVSAAALAVATRNTSRHNVSDRVSLLQGDVYGPVAGLDQHFDAVISNPPYIPTADVLALHPTVRDYEPSLALDGGPDGLAVYRRLTQELQSLKYRPGFLAFEVGCGQADEVARLCCAAGYQNTRQIPDLAGIPRVVTAIELF